jgi:UrcA family protein
MTPSFSLGRIAMAAIAAIIMAASFGASANAAEPVSLAFRFHLDRDQLATQRGVNRVYNKIQGAARLECRRQGFTGDGVRTVDQNCVALLVDNAVSQIQSNELASRYRGSRLYTVARRNQANTLTLALR